MLPNEEADISTVIENVLWLLQKTLKSAPTMKITQQAAPLGRHILSLLSETVVWFH